MPDILLVELVLRGMAIGALAATGFAFFRSGASVSVRIAGLLFCLSIITYVVNSSPALRPHDAIATILVALLSIGGSGYAWLFVFTLFEDRRITLIALAPIAALTVVGLFGIAVGHPASAPVWIVHNLMEIGLALHALFIIYRSWRGDLVEARRRLRGPFMGFVALYMIVLSVIEIGENVGVAAAWYSLAGGVALAFTCLLGAFVFLEPRPALFGAAEPAPAEVPRLDAADRLTLDKLQAAMDAGEAWRREGITIGALAEQVGVPEHRLRRLINDHLGQRNFAAFVNARRIEAAKRILSDPAQARTTVAAVAFDLGFGSLGPFNRAFREATDKTPTQWRREALEKPSPNSENPS